MSAGVVLAVEDRALNGLRSRWQGLFSNFKWGTEVEVGPAKKPKKATKQGRRFGDGAGSDRGLGGNVAYRNTETARFGGADEGQMIRKAKLEAYINSTEEAADKSFGRLIAGSFLLTLIALLGGVARPPRLERGISRAVPDRSCVRIAAPQIAYYGLDGLIAAPTRM